MLREIPVETQERQELHLITSDVQQAIADSGVQSGICILFSPHTTAGLTINSYLDPNTPEDIMHEWDRLIPTRFDFFHQFDTPTDASGHVKSALMGITYTLIIHEGALLLGHSQGIVFAEFDGPRDRKLIVKVVSD